MDPEGEGLRALVVKEAVYVTEAIVLGTAIDTYNSIPEFMRSFAPIGSTLSPFKFKEGEQEKMMELRDRVVRIWGLLGSSQNFDPNTLLPILQVEYAFNLSLSCSIHLFTFSKHVGLHLHELLVDANHFRGIAL